MARTRTLALLEADVRWQADREGTALRNQSAQVRRAINQSIAEFREAVSESGDPYFLTKSQGSLSVGPTSPYHFALLDLSALSPAHLRVYGFDVNVNGFWRSLDPAMFRERNDVQVMQPGGSSIPLQFFQFDRTSVGYAPASSSAYDYLLWYLPVHADLTADADTFDGMNGWEDWVVFNAVSRLLLRDRDAHLERFEAERARILARVLHVARQRQRAGAQVRGGVRGSNDWRGRGRPDFFSGPGDGLNQPGSGEAGRLALGRSDGKINWYPGADEGDDLKWSGGIWIKRRGWLSPDVDPTGVVDATTAVQAALNTRTGACVNLPDGKLLIGGNLTIPAGVTLTGSPQSLRGGPYMFSPLNHAGTLILATSTGRLFTPAQNSQVLNLGVHYPNQVTNATPTVYDYTFWIDTVHGVAIENCYVTNPYRLLWINNAGGARIDNVYSWPLSRGIVTGRVPDVLRTSNVHFNPVILDSNNTATTLKAWVLANGVAFILDGAESYDFTDCFAISYAIGFWAADFDGDSFWGASGNWKGGSFDNCAQCVVLDSPPSVVNAGIKFYGVNMAPATGGLGVVCNDNQALPGGNSYYRPAIDLTDCAIGGGAQYGIALVCNANSRATISMVGGTVQNFTLFGASTAGANAKIAMNTVRRWTTLLGGSAITNGGTGITDINGITV
jgi:hypothetical protein